MGMKTSSLRLTAALFAAALSATPLSAQTTASSPAGSATSAAVAPDEVEMMKQMIELAKLNENHKLLASLVGTWSVSTKMWMNPDPNAAPLESKGTAVRKPIMNGRYFVTDNTGSMPMPGPDGKMKMMDFKGMSLEAYDNVKKKFVSTWIDSMGTGILTAEGTYDPGSKTFSYEGDCEVMPGMKMHIREVIKIVDKDHHTFEWYDNSRGAEAKTMEISYTRKK